MNPSDASAELLLQIRQDRDAIERELESLAAQNERLFAATSEDTLSGHLRRAVHASRRPMADIAREAGIAAESLAGFLEGEHGLPSETLDQLARAAGVVVSLSRLQDKGG
jgi:DNA-binding phage protein